MEKETVSMYDVKKQAFKPGSVILFCAYILLLFITATTRDFGVTPLIARSSGPIAAAFVEPLWKFIFWISPALLFITYVNGSHILTYLKLVGNVTKGVLWGLLGSSVFFLKWLVRVLLTGIHLHASFNDWLNGVILVGLIEELVFRGFLFQQLRTWWWKESPPDAPPSRLVSFMEAFIEAWIVLFRQLRTMLLWWKETPSDVSSSVADDANEEEAIDTHRWIPNRGTFWAATVSSLLFVTIHFPVWILQHLPLDQMVATSLFNLVFGYALCVFFTQSRSLWACILMHSVNNLVLTII
jgi:membrane protease YdiL (CAAX protease family)